MLPDISRPKSDADTPVLAREKVALPEAAPGSSRRPTRRHTHWLAASLEIDANYKQYQTAKRLRSAAAERLEAQRGYYEEGRITIDRFLDAVSQYAAAVASEAEFKCTYNIALVVFEEIKGTLLSFDKITVTAPPKTGKARSDAAPSPAPPMPLPTPAELPQQSVTRALGALPRKAHDVRAKAVELKDAVQAGSAESRTVPFEFTARVGARSLAIRGSVTLSSGEPTPAAKAP